MSYGWEAKWIRRKFRMGEGIEVETCQDITTGLIICPMCINISKLCPSHGEPTQLTISSGAMLFFTPEDLFHHMKAHAKSGEWKSYTISEEEEEVEEIEEVEEEELSTEGL